jgi:GH25 family lysozyme M1 (1,4-beta-N-acetylmuramidase)
MRSGLFLVVVAVGGLAACAPDESAQYRGVAHAGTDTVENAQTVCGAGPTVPGVDVSYYQQNVDWNAVAAAGYKFAIARHSDGYFHDPKFQQNWDGIKNAGMIRGVYQWFEPNQDPLRQANELIAAVGMLQPGDLPVMADVEEPGPNVPAPAEYVARLRIWINRIREGTGRDPMIYTGHYYWPQYLATTEFSNLPLVHAQYTSRACPNIPDAWSQWAIWQWSSTGSVPGIPGNVDLNRFNGTMEQLQALAGGGTDPQCVANPNYGGCNGTVITHCDNGQVTSGDCGFYGAGCSVEGGTPHCVHPYCIIHGAGENATWCEGSIIKTCSQGQYTEGDCGFYGAACSELGGTAHCVHPYCAPHGENSTWCEGSVIKTCALGQYTEGDCGAYGAACSELGGAAHCVHPYCAPHGENSAWCEGSVIKTCAVGQYSEGDCGAYGASCSDFGGTGHCVHPYCAGHGENSAWCDGEVSKACALGVYAETDCAATGRECQAGGTTSSCAAPAGMDAGTPLEVDAGGTVEASPDAGASHAVDAGSAVRGDASVFTAADGGTVVAPEADAGQGAGEPAPPQDVSTGGPLGCSNAGPDAVWGVMVLAAWWVRRRR